MNIPTMQINQRRMTYVEAGCVFRIRKLLAGQVVSPETVAVDLIRAGTIDEVSQYEYGASFAEFLERNRNQIQLYEQPEDAA